ncbi:MAG: hypothetical protein ACC613_03510 [Synergistales bacterium]
MKNTIGGFFLPPLPSEQHPLKHVFGFSAWVLASNPHGIVSKLGDFLIDNGEKLLFHLAEHINRCTHRR